MASRRGKQPKFTKAPSSAKTPKIGVPPENSERERPAWQLGQIDFAGPWGWSGLTKEILLNEVHEKLRHFESMTWAEIQAASGGRRSGNNSHEVAIDDLCEEARKRLVELQQADVDSLFSLRLSGKARIWGIKSGRILRVLWFDPKHEVCPL